MQCGVGHFLCWSCSLKPEIGRVCPSCRENFVGRAHGMEAYLKIVSVCSGRLWHSDIAVTFSAFNMDPNFYEAIFTILQYKIIFSDAC